MPARMLMSASTISSSINVKPRAGLPVTVLRSIERLAVERRVDVEHVLPAPPRRIRLVLVRAQAPLGAARHRIDRHAPQKLQLPAGRVVRGGDAFDQGFEIGGIVLAADLDVERSDLA